MTLHIQWLTIMVMFSSGLLLGILLDAYRVCKDIFQIRGWVLACIDLLYWFFSAYLVFGLLWWSNWGELRFYIFVAVCFGFFIYFRWFSKRVSFILQSLLQYVITICGWIISLVWLVCLKPIFKIISAVRFVTIWVVIRLPRFISIKWLRPLLVRSKKGQMSPKNREKK